MPRGKRGLVMNSANAIPEGIDTFENDAEANEISSKKPLKKAKGRAKKGAKTEVHSNGEADQNGVEELSKDDAYEMSDKNSSKPSSEDDINSNQQSENEDMGSDPSVEEKPQKKKRGRQRKERKVSNKSDDLSSHGSNMGEGSEKNDDPETNGDDNKVEEEEMEAMPKKRGGRNAKKTGRGRKPASSKEDENEEEETEIMPKKRGGRNTTKTGRGRKPVSYKEDENQSDESEEQLATVPEEKETDEDDLAQPQKAAPSRGRGRKPAAVEAKPRAQKAKKNVEPEEAKTKGRKRKTPTETVDEAIFKKLNAEDLEEAKSVRVSLQREQLIEDMALNLMKSDEGKVQAAAGTAGKGRGKKRAAESEDSASTSKKGKATASKAAPKREKIPDVNALDFGNESTNAKGKSWNLKIATWNVNGLRAWLEKDGLTYLTHEDPDILCIQETKCSEDKIPPESNPVGYHCYWLAGDKEGYSGVGIMSKQKPLSVEYGIRKKVHDAEGRVITAEYDEFYLVATYVPNAGRKLVRLDYRKQWDIDFRAYLKKLDKTKPVILCGDLNVAHNEIDLANPKTNKKNAGFTQEERDGFSSLLSEGFVDAFRHLYPDTKDAYTFWTYMSSARAKNVGWRLDYFVLSEKITENLCDCVIRKDVMGSDHCPLVLFLRI